MYFCTYAFLAGLYGPYGTDILTPLFVIHISKYHHHHHIKYLLDIVDMDAKSGSYGIQIRNKDDIKSWTTRSREK
jgi:hypothetical protein